MTPEQEKRLEKLERMAEELRKDLQKVEKESESLKKDKDFDKVLKSDDSLEDLKK